MRGRLVERGFGQFLLLATGSALIGVSTLNFPHREHTARLERQRDELRTQLGQLSRERQEFAWRAEGLRVDAYYRQSLLRKLLGLRGEGELTLDDHRAALRGERPFPVRAGE